VKSLPPEVERRRRLVTRTLPLAAVALIAFVAGVIKGSAPPAHKQAAEDFVSAWARQDFAAMHAELNPDSQRRYYAQQTATLRTLDPGGAEGPDSSGGQEVFTVPIELGTVAFGRFAGDLRLPFADGGIAWDPHLAFPGLRPGEQLEDRVALAHRGPILARDGTFIPWAARRSMSPARSANPTPRRFRHSPARASRPERRSGSAASSGLSTGVWPASQVES
jgi:hypothetical protein